MDEDRVTLDGQFVEFGRFMDNKRDGTSINLWRSDYWMRQGYMLDDRKLTMTDTGVAWNTLYFKTELNFDEWYVFLSEVCVMKDFDQVYFEQALTNCGLPGITPVHIPQFRDYFDTYKSKSKMIYEPSDE